MATGLSYFCYWLSCVFSALKILPKEPSPILDKMAHFPNAVGIIYELDFIIYK